MELLRTSMHAQKVLEDMKSTEAHWLGSATLVWASDQLMTTYARSFDRLMLMAQPGRPTTRERVPYLGVWRAVLRVSVVLEHALC